MAARFVLERLANAATKGADGIAENRPDRFTGLLVEFRRLGPLEDYAGRKGGILPQGGDYCRRPNLSDSLD